MFLNGIKGIVIKGDGGIFRQLLLRCSTTYVHVGNNDQLQHVVKK